MYSAPSSRRPLPVLGIGGGDREVISIGKDGPPPARPPSHAGSGRAMRRRQPLTAAPWESMAVQRLASKLNDPDASSSAMLLEGPEGVVLQAVGSREDHRTAGEVIAGFQRERGVAGAPEGHLPRRPTPPAASSGGGQRLASRRGSEMQLGVARKTLSFGAVYEHRDSSGKPRLLGSTGVLPERQFQLDWEGSTNVRDLAKDGAPGSTGHVVWAGVGAGPIGQQEMDRVRQAVVDARSERLKVEKLSGVKPYSRHS